MFQEWVKSLSHVWLFATPWTVAYQAPPSIRFSRQECWSGLPFPSQGDLPIPGIEPRSPALQADALPSEPPGKPQSQVKYSKSGWGKLKTSDLMLLSKYKREPEAWNKRIVPFYESEATSLSTDVASYCESEATSSSLILSISSDWIPGFWRWTPAHKGS